MNLVVDWVWIEQLGYGKLWIGIMNSVVGYS
jgi:hypothetical protein